VYQREMLCTDSIDTKRNGITIDATLCLKKALGARRGEFAARLKKFPAGLIRIPCAVRSRESCRSPMILQGEKIGRGAAIPSDQWKFPAVREFSADQAEQRGQRRDFRRAPVQTPRPPLHTLRAMRASNMSGGCTLLTRPATNRVEIACGQGKPACLG
jgi:hypothetical protein